MNLENENTTNSRCSNNKFSNCLWEIVFWISVNLFDFAFQFVEINGKLNSIFEGIFTVKSRLYLSTKKVWDDFTFVQSLWWVYEQNWMKSEPRVERIWKYLVSSLSNYHISYWLSIHISFKLNRKVVWRSSLELFGSNLIVLCWTWKLIFHEWPETKALSLTFRQQRVPSRSQPISDFFSFEND